MTCTPLARTQQVGRFTRYVHPHAGKIQCLDCSSHLGPLFVAQVLDAEDQVPVYAETAVSAQLELLGRLGAQ